MCVSIKVAAEAMCLCWDDFCDVYNGSINNLSRLYLTLNLQKAISLLLIMINNHDFICKERFGACICRPVYKIVMLQVTCLLLIYNWILIHISVIEFDRNCSLL